MQPSASGSTQHALDAAALKSGCGAAPGLHKVAPVMLQPHLVMPYEFTLAEATDVLQAAGSNTSDYLKVVLRRRDVLAPQLNCLVNAFAESEVLDSASAKAAWVPGTLSGIPWVLKDCVDYSGKKTTGGMSASMIDHPVAQADAPVVRALREAGAVCVGKANLPDLHLGLSTSKSSFGPVKNPYNLRLPAIGSSGGVAAAVAARCAVFGIGVDTGGCLRIPSSLCGVCGFRPSYERYDTSGLLHQSITRDTPGAIARTVEDLQMIDAILKTTAVRGTAPAPKLGATAAQPTGSGGATGAAAGAGGAVAGGSHGIMHAVASAVKSVTGKPIAGSQVHRADFKPASLAGLRLGVPRKHYYDADPGVLQVVEAALATLKSHGVELVEGDFLPGHEPWELDQAVGAPIRAFEILREVSRYGWEHGSNRGVRDLVEQFPGAPADKQMLESQMSGDPAKGAVTAVEYRDALLVHRPRLQQAFADYFMRHSVEAILYPATALPTREISKEGTVEFKGTQQPAYPSYTRNTAPTSNAGIPACAFPVGMHPTEHVPLGLEAAGPFGSDERLLAIARALQDALPKIPPPDLAALASGAVPSESADAPREVTKA